MPHDVDALRANDDHTPLAETPPRLCEWTKKGTVKPDSLEEGLNPLRFGSVEKGPGNASPLCSEETLSPCCLVHVPKSASELEAGMRTKHKYFWEEPFHEAIFEVNPEDLVRKIVVARAAINARVSELLLQDGRRAERHAIIDALSSLQLLEMARLSSPTH